MDSIKNFKDKISDKLSNEVIGEINDPNEAVSPPPLKENKKQKKEKFSLKDVIPEKTKSKPKSKPKKKHRKYEEEEEYQNNNSAVLSLLGIEMNMDTSKLMSMDEINNTRFSLISPTGAHPREVDKFKNKAANTILQYNKMLEQRNNDINKLVNEIARLENIMQEEQQKSELTAFITSQQDEETRLKNELADLRIENLELKQKLDKIQSSRKDLVFPDLHDIKEEKKPNKTDIPNDEDMLMSLLDEL